MDRRRGPNDRRVLYGQRNLEYGRCRDCPNLRSPQSDRFCDSCEEKRRLYFRRYVRTRTKLKRLERMMSKDGLTPKEPKHPKDTRTAAEIIGVEGRPSFPDFKERLKALLRESTSPADRRSIAQGILTEALAFHASRGTEQGFRSSSTYEWMKRRAEGTE